METKRYRLSELLSIKNGKDYKHLNQGEIPVFGSGGYMLSVDSYLYDKASILLPRKGTLSNIQFYNNGPFWTVDTCFYSKINEELVDPYYLYRYLRGLDLSGFDTGASIPSMTQKTYNSIKVDLPSLPTQQKIATILSAYDSQIENNQKRIKLLEQMAENLYKEWFVRFRFPGYETAEFVGGVPKGWKKEKLQDSVRIVTGKKDANYGTEDGLYPFFTCAQEAIKAPDYSFDLNAVILAGNGDFNVKMFKGKFEAYQRTYVMNPHNPLLLYVLYYTVQENMKHLYQGATGSTIKFLTIGMINRITMIVPPDTILKRFYSICDDLQKEKEILIQSTKYLTTQRDLLLPRLMSGKLSI